VLNFTFAIYKWHLIALACRLVSLLRTVLRPIRCPYTAAFRSALYMIFLLGDDVVHQRVRLVNAPYRHYKVRVLEREHAVIYFLFFTQRPSNKACAIITFCVLFTYFQSFFLFFGNALHNSHDIQATSFVFSFLSLTNYVLNHSSRHHYLPSHLVSMFFSIDVVNIAVTQPIIHRQETNQKYRQWLYN